MPSKSKSQHRFMEAVAHSKPFARKAGVPQSIGKEFALADAGRKIGALPKHVAKAKKHS